MASESDTSDPRLAPIYAILESEALDAVAFVPGPNFQRIFGANFHLMERPLVVIIPRIGQPAAIVPDLEMASFEKLKFSGHAFSWKDETGYAGAFAVAGDALPALNDAKKSA